MAYRGHEYIRKRTINGVIYWRCRHHISAKCFSKMRTGERDHDILSDPTDHSHDSFPQKIKVNMAISSLKMKVSAVGASPRGVLGSVLHEMNLPNEILSHMPKKSLLHRALNRVQNTTVGHIPNPVSAQFQIPDKYSSMILFDSGEDDPDRILAIGNRELLRQLITTTIFGDGTFDKVPNMFYQLYTWHAKVGNSYPPCIYFLLQKKDVRTYNRMFGILKELMPDLMPETVLVDFEKAAMNAAQAAFPTSQLKGCYFHLSQNLLRKISAAGLRSQYDDHQDIQMRLKFKSLSSLAFVPLVT